MLLYKHESLIILFSSLNTSILYLIYNTPCEDKYPPKDSVRSITEFLTVIDRKAYSIE